MNEIDISRIISAVKTLCMEANYLIDPIVRERLRIALKKEDLPIAREILEMILENHILAHEKQMPICQDCGVVVVFIELGQDVHIVGGDFYEAIQEGVRRGYSDGYLRKSIVSDPIFGRKNTQDNTPAIIHTEIVQGNSIQITIAPKGGGAENMSEIKMLKPADGIEGMKNFIIDCVKRAGGNPCPPVIVGVGVGGDFEQCALMAKKALLRPLNEPNSVLEWAEVERDLLARINDLGIGPMGTGGKTTALAVQIIQKPCHMASLPVAVNIQCHAHRHRSIRVE
ncbi:MAG: fumarate hydratase [Candidatus Marinimicrobia bacterium]|nr:fumarate hydratase [Candidatus Neomarinimicrobiota bacterium]